MNAQSPPSKWRAATLLTGLLAAYAALMYYGFGPFPTESPVPWWQPRGFLTHSSLLAPFGEDPIPPIVAYSLPALALALAIGALTRSALLRTLALTLALSTSLYLFYGLRWPGPQIWGFFGWRGGAVMMALAGVVSAALLSPVLAAAWLRRSWVVRVLTYVPIVALVVWVATSATGTNPALRFNITPWPVVTVFGFDLLASLIAALLACLGLGLAALRWRERSLSVTGLGLAAAIALPVVWRVLDLAGGMWLLATSLAVGVAALYLAARASGNLTMGVRSGAGYVALGAILVATPLLVGTAWRRMDYTVTRDIRAQRIIDALAVYYEREGGYPEDLEELIEFRYIDALPTPRIGLAPWNGEDFTYQNFGTDYLLEFAAPGWSQCAYSPPWEDWDEEEEYDEDEEEIDPFAPTDYPPEDAPELDPDAGLGPLAAGLPAADEDVVLPEEGSLGPEAAGLPAADYDAEVGGLGPQAAGLPAAEEELDSPGERLDGSWTCPRKPPELW